MDSTNDEKEQSTTELQYLGFLKEIAVKFLLLLSNVYEFAKENSGGLKTTIDYAENVVVSAVGQVYEELKDLPEQILVFVDGKLDTHAPTFIRSLATKFQSQINKIIPRVEALLTKAWSQAKTLVHTALSLLQKALSAALSLLQKLLTAIKSILLISKAQSLLKNSLTTAKSLIKSLVQKSITAAPDLANQLLDATKSTVGYIPIVGKPAQALINQLLDTVKENPVLKAVNSTIHIIMKQAQIVGTKAALQAGYTSFKLVALPVIAQVWYKANTYPLFNTVAEVILPVAESSSEWYNKVVSYMDGKGYGLFGYLPLVPVDEMKATYKMVKLAKDGLSTIGGVVGMHFDK